MLIRNLDSSLGWVLWSKWSTRVKSTDHFIVTLFLVDSDQGLKRGKLFINSLLVLSKSDTLKSHFISKIFYGTLWLLNCFHVDLHLVIVVLYVTWSENLLFIITCTGRTIRYNLSQCWALILIYSSHGQLRTMFKRLFCRIPNQLFYFIINIGYIQ